MNAANMPIRILHVVGHRMHWGGTETWLMHVLRHVDRTRFQMDFLVHTEDQWTFDEEIRALGGRVLRCLHPSRPWAYARQFSAVLQASGPYDIVHSHVHHFGGYIARLAHRLGVPVRIVHSHCATSMADQRSSLWRRLYMKCMSSWINRYATCGLAASQEAAVALYGSDWKSDARWRVLYCGIDLKPFETPITREEVRAELGIPADAFVIGHVGMFTPPKNQAWVVRMAGEVIRRMPETYFVFVGDGPLRPETEADVSRRGIAKNVIFCGARSDVPRLMRGAMDGFVFPSRWEGLPLALIEAQAAGLRCFISDAITEESDVVPHLITRLPLSQPISVWADAVLRSRTSPAPVAPAQATTLVARSPLNSETSAHEIAGLYASLADRN